MVCSYLHVKATNGESFEDQYRRVADFLDELRQKPYEQVAIFAHGGILLNAQIYAGIIKPKRRWRTHSLWRNCQDRVIMM
mgnify:FL=1